MVVNKSFTGQIKLNYLLSKLSADTDNCQLTESEKEGEEEKKGRIMERKKERKKEEKKEREDRMERELADINSYFMNLQNKVSFLRCY